MGNYLYSFKITPSQLRGNITDTPYDHLLYLSKPEKKKNAYSPSHFLLRQKYAFNPNVIVENLNEYFLKEF